MLQKGIRQFIQTFNHFHDTFIALPNISGNALLELLERTQAHKDSTKLIQLYDACHAYQGSPLSYPKQWLFDAITCHQSISIADIDPTLTKKAIGDALSYLRCQALHKLLSNFQKHLSLGFDKRKNHDKTALITGGAKRIGAAITNLLHQHGFNVIIHYHTSQAEADKLSHTLNQIRPNSATTLCANLDIIHHQEQLSEFSKLCIAQFGRIDALIHNASSFYPSDLNDTHQTLLKHWDNFILNQRQSTVTA